MESKEEILKRDFSDEFVTKMRNAIEMSHYKYGWMSDTYPYSHKLFLVFKNVWICIRRLII